MIRSLLGWLRDMIRGPRPPAPNPLWSTATADPRADIEKALAALEAESAEWPWPVPTVEEFRAMQANDPLVKQILDAAGHAADQAMAQLLEDLELGTALVDPDAAGDAHRPSDTRPLDLTACELSRRRFSWTMPVSEVPRSRRCATCFPAPTRVEIP